MKNIKVVKKKINVSDKKLSKVFSILISLKYSLIYFSINKTQLNSLRIFLKVFYIIRKVNGCHKSIDLRFFLKIFMGKEKQNNLFSDNFIFLMKVVLKFC